MCHTLLLNFQHNILLNSFFFELCQHIGQSLRIFVQDIFFGSFKIVFFHSQSFLIFLLDDRSLIKDNNQSGQNNPNKLRRVVKWLNFRDMRLFYHLDVLPYLIKFGVYLAVLKIQLFFDQLRFGYDLIALIVLFHKVLIELFKTDLLNVDGFNCSLGLLFELHNCWLKLFYFTFNVVYLFFCWLNDL